MHVTCIQPVHVEWIFAHFIFFNLSFAAFQVTYKRDLAAAESIIKGIYFYLTITPTYSPWPKSVCLNYCSLFLSKPGSCLWKMSAARSTPGLEGAVFYHCSVIV